MFDNRRRPVIARLCVLTSVLVLAVACGSEDGGGGTDGGAEGATEITIAISAEPGTLDPYTSGLEADFVNAEVYETLVRSGPEGELETVLASEMPRQIDDVTWEIPLVEDVEFHDGSPFTADAVVHAFELILDNERVRSTSPLMGTWWYTFAGVEKVDEHTVRVTTTERDHLFAARLERVPIVHPTLYDDGAGADEPVGTGPYRFVSWTRGQDLVLERWDEHPREDPEVAKATFEFIPESGARTGALLAGEVDIIRELSLEDADQVPHYTTSDTTSLGLFALNTAKAPLDDARVRQAMSLAINREELVELLGAAQGEIPSQLLDESWFGADPDLSPLEYDPEAAKELIDEAGAAGETIVMSATLEAGFVAARPMLEAVVAEWEAIGLTVEVQYLSVEDYIGVWRGPEEARTHVLHQQHTNDLADADTTFTTWYGSVSWTGDAEVAALIDEARVEVDEERRLELYQQVTAIGLDEMLTIPMILMRSTIVGLAEDVEWEPFPRSRIFRLVQVSRN